MVGAGAVGCTTRKESSGLEWREGSAAFQFHIFVRLRSKESNKGGKRKSTRKADEKSTRRSSTQVRFQYQWITSKTLSGRPLSRSAPSIKHQLHQLFLPPKKRSFEHYDAPESQDFWLVHLRESFAVLDRCYGDWEVAWCSTRRYATF